MAAKLDDIYKTGKLAHVELDERALDALREFPVDGALNVLSQFLESNLEHVSNKSAYLCGVMKTYRQKSRASQQGIPTPTATVNTKGPDEEKIKKILERTGYTLDVTTGKIHQTKYEKSNAFNASDSLDGQTIDSFLFSFGCNSCVQFISAHRSKKVWWSTAHLGRTNAWQWL